MPVVIACPKCQQQYQLPQDPAGRQVKCPGCQTVFAARAQQQAPAAAPAMSPEERQKLAQKQQAEKAAMTQLGIQGPLADSPKLFPEQAAPQVDPLGNHIVNDPGFAEIDIEAIRQDQAARESEMFKNPFQTGEKKADLSNNSDEMDVNAIFMSFDGRIPRKTFWIAWLSLTGIIIGIMLALFLALGPTNIGFIIANVILGIVNIWFSLAIQVKRWHDRGKSGWWVLINFTGILSIWALIECGFLKGTEGRNKYGLDPLAEKS